MSLEQFMANEHINIKDVALIKMDTEGGEIKILPQLKPFIAKYKPNILLSLVRTCALHARVASPSVLRV